MIETNVTTKSEFMDNSITEILKILPTENDQREFVKNVVESFCQKPSDKYNDEFYFDIVKPAISALVRLKEDSAKELRQLKALISEKDCANEGTDYAVEVYEGFLEQLNDILLDYDVLPFKCEGIVFNPLRQTVVKKLPPQTPEQIKTVAASLGEGHERKGIVIAKERVAAYGN